MISERERDYLQTTLRMNPMFESGELLTLRRTLLQKERLDHEESVVTGDRRNQRDALRTQVRMVQRDFWKLPLDQLEPMLNGMDTKNFPELGPVVHRLRTVATSRGDFPKLAQTPGMHMGLFNAFKVIVVLPPGDAVRVKSQFARSIQDKKHLKEIQKGVALIGTEFPHLMELEKDWFNTLSKMTRVNAAAQSNATGMEAVRNALGSIFELPWYTWWIAAMAIKAILITSLRP